MQFYKACNQFQSNLFDNIYATNHDDENYEDDDNDDDDEDDDEDDDDVENEINVKNVEWEIGRRVCWNLSKQSINEASVGPTLQCSISQIWPSGFLQGN